MRAVSPEAHLLGEHVDDVDGVAGAGDVAIQPCGLVREGRILVGIEPMPSAGNSVGDVGRIAGCGTPIDEGNAYDDNWFRARWHNLAVKCVHKHSLKVEVIAPQLGVTRDSDGDKV